MTTKRSKPAVSLPTLPTLPWFHRLRRSPRPLAGLARYALAFASVAAALGIEAALGTTVTGVSPLFFVAVVFSSVVGGWGPGLLATILASACTAFVAVETTRVAEPVGIDDLFRLGVFASVALAVSWLQSRQQRATIDAGTATADAHAARRQADNARRQAEAANAAKDRFLNVLGHELRNPLNPVLSLVTMRLQDFDSGRIAEDGDPQAVAERLRDDLELIRRNVEVEARLIDDLLDSSRIRSGKLRLVRQGTNLAKLVAETVEAVRPAATAAGLTLELRPTPGMDGHRPTVDGDPIRLRQVFWNLLNNAVKFTRRGGRVTVMLRPTLGRRGVVVTVADTGRGIDGDLVGVIFEPFVQAERVDAYAPENADDSDQRRQDDAATFGEAGGLGLGLSLVRGFVTAHGGTVSVRSRPGKGSVFRVRLPAAWLGADERRDDEQDAAEIAGMRPARGEAQSRPVRVLLVEDHPDTARVTARLLRREGHDVVAASGVGDALAAADAERFDLVVSDIGLGDGNGWELMAQLRDRHGLSGIAVSGYATDADVRRSKASGFLAHLVKPLSLETLCEQIDKAAEALEDDEDEAAVPAELWDEVAVAALPKGGA